MMIYDATDFLTQRQQKMCEGMRAGVYLLHNKIRDKYYVGQSHRPADRVFKHLNGMGNGDVYADYKNGEGFTVRFYPLKGSGFRDLNELEYHLIRIYEPHKGGYNRQAGNTTRQAV